MSIGPSTLGNLLVQRLDSALGISQTTQHRTGAHPDALRHTQSIQRLIQSDNPTARSSRESVDKARQHDSSRVKGRADPRLESQLQKYTDNRFTPSAPTTLGRTARTILALLTQYAHQPVQGQRPLVNPQQLNTPSSAQGSNSNPASQPTTPSPTHQATRPSAPPTHLTQLTPTKTATATAVTTHSAPSNASTAGAAQHGKVNTSAALPAQSSSTPTPQSITSSQTSQTNQTHLLPQGSTTAPTSTATTAQSTPIVSSHPVVQAFAQALQHNVQQSGLFYESKLAQLVKGQTQVESLQQQPQAHAHQRAQAPAPSVLSQLAATPSQQADAPTVSLQQSGIDPSTQQLVRQQLEVLANQIFNWRGEAWHGVPMEWEIERRHEEDADSGPHSGEEDETPWQTRLALQLPALGHVQARLHIQDNVVRLHITAPDAADRLQQNLTSLVNRLEAQGIAIQQLQIVREEDTYPEPDPYYDENHPYY